VKSDRNASSLQIAHRDIRRRSSGIHVEREDGPPTVSFIHQRTVFGLTLLYHAALEQIRR